MLQLLLLLAQPVEACLWDRDTLAQESKGLPELTRILTGRFERFPPRYYAIRLERVSAELKADPTLLGLYDDAAVALDRLGRTEEAIVLMEQKAAQLERLERGGAPMSEDWYKTLANLGTFYAHRWVQGPHEPILAFLRARELLDAGKNSYLPVEHLESVLPPPPELAMVDNHTGLSAQYQKLRNEAESWQKRRFDWMEQRFNQGKHPDTHPDFWAGFK
jgi:hypothetical protein